jgi:tRNA threonylcarbamoyladenosine biosynthesis protein TsaB
VAILDGRTVLCQSNEEAGLNHAKWLVPTIDRLLQSSGLTLSTLDGFAVSIGPGSFTGLRVGLATVMGFRMVTGLPLVTVPTLEALAWNLRAEDRPLCPVLKARTGEVYWAFYRWDHAGRPTRLVEERVGSLASLARSIPSQTVMLGEGWVTYREELHGLLAGQSHEVCGAPDEAMATSAVSVGLAGLDRLARGEVAGRGVTPFYVQRVEAEATGPRPGCVSPSVKARV